ncbi:MAG: hypothetical protein AAB875_07005 [Patescibacteria group bacterium]
MIDPNSGARFVPSTSSLPSSTEIADFINQSEDEIDRYTNRAWRSTTQTTEHHTPWGPMFFNYRYVLQLKLDHSNVKTFTSGSGDKIEYFNGSSWIDLLTTGTAGDGYGEGDYWCDPENAILYLHTGAMVRGQSTIRVTYRYGASTIPNDIKNACIMMSAKSIIESDFYSRHFPSNTDHVPQEALIESFNRHTYRILDRYRDINWL